MTRAAESELAKAMAEQASIRTRKARAKERATARFADSAAAASSPGGGFAAPRSWAEARRPALAAGSSPERAAAAASAPEKTKSATEPRTAIASAPAARGDRVVDARGRSGEAVREGAHDRGAERRDRQAHSSAEQKDARQKCGPVFPGPRRQAREGNREKAEPGDGGPQAQEEARAVPIGQASGPAREQGEKEGEGHEGQTRLGLRVTLDLDQVERHEQGGGAQCAVEEKREKVRAGEIPRGEDRERQHRRVQLPLHDQEADGGEEAEGETQEYPRVRKAQSRSLDESVGEGRESQGREGRARQVDPSPKLRVAAFGHSGRQQRGRDPERQVDEKDGPPEPEIGENAAEGGSDDGDQRGDRRPGADGPTPALGGDARGDDRETARDHQGPAEPLDGPGADQEADGRRETAGAGGGGEEEYSRPEYPPASQAVAEASPHEDERSQDHQIDIGHPEELRPRRAKARLYDGESHVERGTVDEGHARRQYRRGENPGLAR